MCISGTGRMWLLFAGVWFWVRGDVIVSKRVVVGVLLWECVAFNPRLWRLCGNWSCVVVGVAGCTESDCGIMSGQNSLSGRSLCVVYKLSLFLTKEMLKDIISLGRV